jgi:TnpA family transposase
VLHYRNCLLSILAAMFTTMLPLSTGWRYFWLVRYQHIGLLVRGAIKPRLFLAHWDDLLRAAGSLKLGWVTASLFIAKLQSSRRKNVLTRALQEYGRLNKTIFILRYLLTEQVQRRIGTQINKGEALHALRGFLFLANEAKIRRRHYEEQLNQASCLNLVTNAVVLWNTVYMSAVLDQLKAQGYRVDNADVAHLWPARYANLKLTPEMNSFENLPLTVSPAQCVG